MGRGRQVGGSCLAGSGAGEARDSSPTASYIDYQISVPFEALVRGKLLRLGLCACTIVDRWIAVSVSSTEVSVFVCVHGYFPYRLIQTSLLKKKELPPILGPTLQLYGSTAHGFVSCIGRWGRPHARMLRAVPLPVTRGCDPAGLELTLLMVWVKMSLID